MEQRSCAGYVITQSIKVKDTEFVLGEHLKTGMCVTWQCKNGDNYFWGHYCENYYELSNKRVFSAVTGVQYHVDRIYGRLTILQGETMIYQESLWDCFFTWLSLISFPCFVASCLIANVTKQRNDPNYYPGSRLKF